jgi:hypothetical protein
MHRSRRLPWILAALLLLVPACGKDDSGSGSGAPGAPGAKMVSLASDLAALVPNDAVALVYARDPAALIQKVKTLVGLFDAEAAADVDGETLKAQLPGGLGRFWDMGRPVALAISIPQGEIESPDALGQGLSIIVPTTDAAGAKGALEQVFMDAPPEQRPAVRTSGTYLSLSMGGAAPTGSSKFAAAPEGDVALRVDLAAVVERFRPQIQEGLGALEEQMSGMADRPGMDTQAQALEGMSQWLLTAANDLVKSAETFDLGLTVEGTTVELAVGFTAKAGSPMDQQSTSGARLAELAAHLPADLPIQVLFAMDLGKMWDWMKPLIEASSMSMPDEQRAGWREYMSSVKDLLPLYGTEHAYAFGFGKDGMRMAYVGTVKDADLLMKKTDELMGSDLLAAAGMKPLSLEPTTVSGVQVRHLGFEFDFEKMMEQQNTALPEEQRRMAQEKAQEMMGMLFGKGGMRMSLASVEGKMLMTMGGDEHMAAVIESVRAGKKKASGALAQAMARAGGQPSFLLSADLRATIGPILELASQMTDGQVPHLPNGKPIPVTVWGNHEGRKYSGGLRLDVGGIKELVEALDR